MTTHDVVIVGAGLAGLAAARELTQHGLDVAVLEAGDTVGGRVRTDHVDGLTLDHGFQLYNPAYPEAARVLDHEALDLRSFTPGVMTLTDRGPARLADPRRRPAWIPDALAPATGTIPAKVRFASYALATALTDRRARETRVDMPADVALLSVGVSPRLLETTLRPFLSGVFLEPDLRTSRRFLDLVLTSFIKGTPAVPAQGMQAIPEQLAASLPNGTLRLQTPARAITSGAVATDDGEVKGDAIVVATDPRTAAALLPGLQIPEGRDVTTYYFIADTPPMHLTGGHPILVVDGRSDPGPVVNTVVMTHAAPSYASRGRTLVSASVLGLHTSPEMAALVRHTLSLLYRADTRGWDLAGTYPIPYALPAMTPPLEIRKPVQFADGVLVAGDHRDTASIQGAMVSGRRCARAALSSIGVTHSR